MTTVSCETTPEFSRGITALIRDARLNSRVVVTKETGELIKTLVRLSPPRDMAVTKNQIQNSIQSKFVKASSWQEVEFGKRGKQGIVWFKVNSRFLQGVASTADHRSSSVAELRRLSFRINRRGSQKMGFDKPRRTQRVLIYQQILTKAETVGGVIKHSLGNIGRLRAAWLPAVTSGQVQLTGSSMPPKFVTKHASGAKGSFVNGLSVTDNPKFTLINSATGIGKRVVAYVIKAALKVRGKAMEKNALLFMKGKKRISDYR